MPNAEWIIPPSAIATASVNPRAAVRLSVATLDSNPLLRVQPRPGDSLPGERERLVGACEPPSPAGSVTLRTGLPGPANPDRVEGGTRRAYMSCRSVFMYGAGATVACRSVWTCGSIWVFSVSLSPHMMVTRVPGSAYSSSIHPNDATSRSL